MPNPQEKLENFHHPRADAEVGSVFVAPSTWVAISENGRPYVVKDLFYRCAKEVGKEAAADYMESEAVLKADTELHELVTQALPALIEKERQRPLTNIVPIGGKELVLLSKPRHIVIREDNEITGRVRSVSYLFHVGGLNQDKKWNMQNLQYMFVIGAGLSLDRVSLKPDLLRDDKRRPVILRAQGFAPEECKAD